LPFLAEFFTNSEAGIRLHPDFLEIDELALLFYQRLEDIRDPFVREYFLFELNLRNIAVALELRQRSLPPDGRLIPIGAAYAIIAAGAGDDFGLTDSFPYVRRLLAPYRETDLTRREQLLDEIRWEWIEERLGSDYFSFDYILGYLVKLLSVERWRSLKEETGSEVFDELLNTVHRSVRFAIEFSKIDQRAAAQESEGSREGEVA
jgi:hypothetical protein